MVDQQQDKRDGLDCSGQQRKHLRYGTLLGLPCFLFAGRRTSCSSLVSWGRMEQLGVGVQQFLQSIQVLLSGDVHVFVNGGLVEAERPLPRERC